MESDNNNDENNATRDERHHHCGSFLALPPTGIWIPDSIRKASFKKNPEIENDTSLHDDAAMKRWHQCSSLHDDALMQPLVVASHTRTALFATAPVVLTLYSRHSLLLLF